MANVITDDEDELEQDEEQKRKQQDPDAPIGKPIAYGSMPKPKSSSVPADMPAPEVGADSTIPKTPPTIAESAPYTPAAPRPQAQAFTDWQAQDLAKHPANQPRYHGLARVADTIAGVTNIGRMAEGVGEFGSLGAQAKSNRLAGNAATEDTLIKEGENEREANAKAEEEQVKTQGEQAGSELVDVTMPDGTKQQVMRKNLASPTAAIINTTGRENVAVTNANAKTDVANINANAKGANARQPIRIMGDATYERQQDGSWKEIGKAPARAEQGSYVPINDEQGNTVGWVNPKSKHMVDVGEIPGMAGEGGAAPSGVIPPKPVPAVAAGEKSAQDSLNYAQQYKAGGKFTGPGDEALMEQFFNVAKPSSGFRMSQPQIDMLLKSRSWMEGAEGQAYHAANGVWFPDQQRNEIIDTMIALGRSKGVGGVKSKNGGPTQPSATGGAGGPTAPPRFGDFIKGGG